jgi:hypothetical protein
MSSVILEMQKYICTNTANHGGDLYAHSVWTLLHTERLLHHQDTEFNRVVAFAAFVHDIGKMTPARVYHTIPDHPQRGYVHILEEGKPLFDAFGIDYPKWRTLVAVVVLLHALYGMRELSPKDYVAAVRSVHATAVGRDDPEHFRQTLTALVGVSLADILAYTPPDLDRSVFFPWIRNVPKKYNAAPHRTVDLEYAREIFRYSRSERK